MPTWLYPRTPISILRPIRLFLVMTGRNGRDPQPSRAMPAFLICCEAGQQRRMWTFNPSHQRSLTPYQASGSRLAASHYVALMGE